MSYQFGITTQAEQYGCWADPNNDDPFGDRRVANLTRSDIPDRDEVKHLLQPYGIHASVETGSAYYEAASEERYMFHEDPRDPDYHPEHRVEDFSSVGLHPETPVNPYTGETEMGEFHGNPEGHGHWGPHQHRGYRYPFEVSATDYPTRRRGQVDYYAPDRLTSDQREELDRPAPTKKKKRWWDPEVILDDLERRNKPRDK